MKGRLFFITLALMLFAHPAVQAAITCTGTDSVKTIAVGETGDITVSCSGITQGTTVTVNAQYSSSCLSARDAIPFSLTYDNPSAQITFEATSMACQYNPAERTITWSFTAPGESISSQTTTVTITSPNSVTASFLNAPYSATEGDSVTIILEVSTGATVDITDVDVDMSTNPTISGITDWNDNTIFSSGTQKTIQKSWTFTAPSPGTYTISAVVTTQNAGGDQASTILTVSSSGAAPSGGTTGGGTTGGGAMAGGLLPREKSASRKPVLVPGVGLRNNTKLQAAIERVLAKGKLSEEAKENLLRLSESITSDIEVQRNFRFSNGSSRIENRYKYKGQKKAKNFMIYEKVPKTFAQSSDNITVSAPGARIEVVEKDPEYLFLYDELQPGDEVVITYTVDEEVDESVIDSFGTEIYAESLEEEAAPTEEAVCTPGERRCFDNEVRECNSEGTGWFPVETCQYGCSNGACQQRVISPIDYGSWIIMAIIIIIVVITGVAIYVLKTKEKTPSMKSVEIGKF
ncbi:MAG TPA: hypothetical protein ENG00_00935 [Candidatus Aenigmarchaeota archaeon]|nr:hypothetical protein [Candidatus Aenigmarchaeota archaeon]